MKTTYLQLPAAAVLAAFTLLSCQKDMSGRSGSVSDLNGSSKVTPLSTVEISCGQHRTQTQGGWGAKPSGNNPGAYLHANFDAAFGELTVGCAPENYYIRLTSAQAVTDLLPTGGKAAALTAITTDPASVKSVLVGQIVALKLSVGFDYNDPNFGESSVPLGKMIIGSGVFKGYAVVDFLNIAEQVLGGCNTAFTPAQVNETASAINENNVDGKTDNGFLVCPDGGGGEDPIEY
ncbi:hypothetical protein [Niastella populi]|uniref:Uncharacterized protein n=1 Tax=Niastella populi TaxID=550983 RepID=A0A1V9FEE2_9BACT|nr:hypothetical protein [Niastella populi]OQP56728.1 hypothetical protein A4R26_25630 [Niastella populi]